MVNVLKTWTVVTLMLAALLIACKKETVEPEPMATVFAGVFDTTFGYYQHPGNTVMEVTWDSLNLYGRAEDSVDLDLNGSFDLYFEVVRFNFDSIHLLNGPSYPLNYPKCVVRSSTEYEFSMYKVNYGTGHGQVGQYWYVGRLDANDPVDTRAYWSREAELWTSFPPSLFAPPGSAWFQADGSDFIAIKRGEYQYGWVEIDASDRNNPIVKSFAIQN